MQEHNITPNSLSTKDGDKNTKIIGINPVFKPETFISQEEFKAEMKPKNGESISANLETVLATNAKLKVLKAGEIKFSEPVLQQGENAVIFPHTINVIQGQAGVHKSRLAENICSALIKKNSSENELLGFNRLSYNATHTVVYVDTERNLTEQLPYALQSIQIKAGYDRTEHPNNFEYISLLQINRKDRFKTLNEYLEHIKKTYQILYSLYLMFQQIVLKISIKRIKAWS